MAEDRFLTDLIGVTTSVSTVVVERGPVAYFAEAVFDDDPIYRDPEAAREAGFDAIPVPPTFPFVMESWGKLAELQVAVEEQGEGLAPALAVLKARGGLILHGEQSFHYYRPIKVGDVLKGTGVIVDAYAKESKGATMSFLVNEVTWSDAETDEPVLTTRFNVIHRL